MRNVLASVVLLLATLAAVGAALLPIVLVMMGPGDIGALRLDIQVFPALLLAMLLINRLLRSRAERHSQFASAVTRFHLWATVMALVLHGAWLMFGWPTAFPEDTGNSVGQMRAVIALFYLTIVIIAAQFVSVGCALACAIGYPWPSRPRLAA